MIIVWVSCKNKSNEKRIKLSFCWYMFLYTLQKKVVPNRDQIDVSWFRKYDSFFIFHNTLLPTWPENDDTKTYKKGKIVFFLNKETKLILLLQLETIPISVCCFLWEQICGSCIYIKTKRNRTQAFKETI